MRIGTWSPADGVLIVAEIGNNHEGSYARAEELIGQAADAGAGAVKFQAFRTESLVGRVDQSRIDRLRGFELRDDEFVRLAAVARSTGLAFISTPFDLEAVELLASLVDAMKVASGDLTFVQLLDAVAQVPRPVLISTGGADDAVVARAVERFDGGRGRKDLCILHCVSSYPTPIGEANLRAITTLRELLDRPVGYSDHTIGSEAAVLAVGLGAVMIEKHFTLDKSFSDFRDHQLSADPSDLRELVERVRIAETLLGDGIKRIMPCEEETLAAMRRSIAARNDLAAGTVLTEAHLTWVRPAGGLPPGGEGVLLGRRLRRNVARGDQLTADLVDPVPASGTA